MDLNGNYRLVASFDGGSNGNLKCGIPQILAIENDDWPIDLGVPYLLERWM